MRPAPLLAGPQVQAQLRDAVLGLIAKMLPDARDQQILIHYLARMVQSPGEKFAWALFLQGVEGNGKSLLIDWSMRAMGDEYVYRCEASALERQFNGWMYGNLAVVFMETKLSTRQDAAYERFKALATERVVPIEFKGVDASNKRVCANVVMLSNHKDGIRKHKNDRRICPLFSAQQDADDLRRDGLTERYFKELVAHMKNGGQEAWNAYLHDFVLTAELDPTGDCWRAPDTTATAEAISEGIGELAEEILEAIEQGQPYFRNGIVSSTGISMLRDRLKIKATGRAVVAAMKSIGYEKAACLPDGRTNAPVVPDNSKPRLYVKQGSIAAQANAKDLLSLYRAGHAGQEEKAAQAFAK